MGWEWLVMPIIGSAIGWLTNYFAIRMLFRPKDPVRVWGRFSVQGVLPRRRDDLARVVAETVENELLPMDELLENINVDGYETDVVQAVVSHVDSRLEASLPNSLPTQIKRMVISYVRRIVTKEASAVVRKASAQLTDRIRSEVSLGDLVRDKMNRLDTDQLEGMVSRVAHKELRVIEVLGAVLGGLIGFVQALLVSMTR